MNASAPRADLWILAGQSNMEGCGPFMDPYPEQPRLHAFYADYAWGPAVPPLHHRYAALDPVHRIICEELGQMNGAMFDRLARLGRKSTPRMAGPGYFFGRYLLRHLPENAEIALLPCAHGGASLNQWMPDHPGEPGATLYSAMIKRWRAAGIGAPRGVLWYQGESEAINGDCDDYLERFVGLVDRMREDFGVPDLPVLTCQLSRVAGCPHPERWEAVREAQRAACDQRRGVHLTGAIDGLLADPIHLDVRTQERLGERLARIALTEVYRVGRFGRTIRLESARADREELALTVRMRFSGVQGRLISAGAPCGFSARDTGSNQRIEPWHIDLNSDGPGTVTVRLMAMEPPATLSFAYGAGMNPVVNITDEADMPLPAFRTELKF